jgi:diacylglycerol kinase (ATP)
MDKNQENQHDENRNEENSEKLKNVKNKNFIIALHHSIDGVIKAFKTERNLRIDYFCAVAVLLAGIILGLSKTEFVCLCLTIGFVIFSEMMNSVSEYIVDLVTDKYDDRAKAAKDIAAGGVLISSSISLIVAYFLFADKLKNATTSILTAITSSNSNILFTIIFIIVVLIIILKGLFGRGEEYAHSGPSLRIALAFGLTTYACIITRSFLVGIICGILSLMIFGMKVNNTKAKAINMVYSALLGIMIVLLVYQLVLIGPDIFKLLSF